MWSAIASLLCYITGRLLVKLRLLELEAVEHALEVSRVECSELRGWPLQLDNIGVAIVQGGIYLDLLRRAVKLVGSDRIGPVFSANIRIRSRGGRRIAGV